MNVWLVGSLRFATDLPVGLVLLTTAACFVAVFAVYRRETAGMAGPWAYGLPVLRGSAVALVVLLLAQPIWHTRTIVGELGHVVFAIDRSASMAMNDSQGDRRHPSRLRRAAALLGGSDLSRADGSHWIQALSQTHVVDVVTFADRSTSLVWTSREEHPPSDPSADDVIASQTPGGGTRLATPLEPFLPQSPRMSPESTPPDVSAAVRSKSKTADQSSTAVVIVSDGRDTTSDSDDDPIEIAQRLSDAGVRVHTLGIGSGSEPVDAGVLAIERPQNVAADGQLAGVVQVKAFGVVGKPLTVSIRHRDQTVWQQTVTPAVDGMLRVPFQIELQPLIKRIDGPGDRRVSRDAVVMEFTAAVETDNISDTLDDNNRKPFRISATNRRRQLLVLDGSSRWEMRYLRNVFQRDPGWDVTTVLFGPGTDQPRLKRSDDASFPTDQNAWSRFDAVILGEIPADQWEDDDSLRLKEFVARGGGLIIVDGRTARIARLADRLLRDLIPARFDTIGSIGADTSDAAAQRLVTPLVDLQSFRLTPVGGDLPMMNLANDAAGTERLWEQLPAPVYAAAVEPAADAEVWIQLIDASSRPHPYLITRLYGAGRVVYLSSDQTWRWRYKVADAFHSRFWNQLLATVMPMPYSASDQYVSVGTDRVEYEPGQPIQIRARLRDVTGNPVGDAIVDAVLMRNDSVAATIPLSIDDPSRGTYVGSAERLPQGKYDIRIRASGFDSDSLRAGTPVWIQPRDDAESAAVGLNESLLRRIAEAGAGSYQHESQPKPLLEALRPLSRGHVIRSDYPLWQSWWWFIAVVGLLATEWLVRKRVGLI